MTTIDDLRKNWNEAKAKANWLEARFVDDLSIDMLFAHIDALTAELAAVTSERDGLRGENAALTRQAMRADSIAHRALDLNDKVIKENAELRKPTEPIVDESVLNEIASYELAMSADAPARAADEAAKAAPKLTKAMVQTLQSMVDIEKQYDHWQHRRIGIYLAATRSLTDSLVVSSSTIKALLSRGLIAGSGAHREYRITDAGRAALKASER